MNKFSRSLSAAVLAAAMLAAAPAQAGPCGQGHCGGGYHGRPAGHGHAYSQPSSHSGVTVFRGGQFRTSPHFRPARHSAAGVIVYEGGTYQPDPAGLGSIEELEVVSVTRGAGPKHRTADAICIAPDGHTMPAARVRLATQIDSRSTAELFRCEPSFTLRGHVGRAGAGSPGGDIVCNPGASLWSAGGSVHCRAKRRLDWSEAELRHAFGTGAILLTAPARADHAAVTVTRGMSLSGGVGRSPY